MLRIVSLHSVLYLNTSAVTFSPACFNVYFWTDLHLFGFLYAVILSLCISDWSSADPLNQLVSLVWITDAERFLSEFPAAERNSAAASHRLLESRCRYRVRQCCVTCQKGLVSVLTVHAESTALTDSEWHRHDMYPMCVCVCVCVCVASRGKQLAWVSLELAGHAMWNLCQETHS